MHNYFKLNRHFKIIKYMLINLIVMHKIFYKFSRSYMHEKIKTINELHREEYLSRINNDKIHNTWTNKRESIVDIPLNYPRKCWEKGKSN